MIQRVQSVYLLLGALALVIVFFVDDAWSSAAIDLGWYIPTLVALAAVTIGAALVAIFLYGNRPRQLKVVVAAQVVTLLFLLVFYGGLLLGGEFQLFAPGAEVAARVVGLLLPIVAYVFFYLARRGIQRDIALVKSMDRLR